MLIKLKTFNPVSPRNNINITYKYIYNIQSKLQIPTQENSALK